MNFPSVTLRLPDWIGEMIADPDLTYPTIEDRMRLAVELSRESIHRGTGESFGAAIFALGGEGQPSYELVTSTEPCSMCFGAIPWSGVRHLVCGARGEDAEAVGFDEGTKPAEWVRSLEERGITVERDVLRDEAASVLRECAERGGEIYNAHQGG